MDLALNNLQRLICHKTQQTKPNQTIIQESYSFQKTLEQLKRILIIFVDTKVE